MAKHLETDPLITANQAFGMTVSLGDAERS